MILETLKWCEMAIVSSWSSHVFFVGGPCKEMTHVAGCCDPQLKKTRICFWFLYLYNIIYIYYVWIYIYECRWYYINSHNMPYLCSRCFPHFHWIIPMMAIHHQCPASIVIRLVMRISIVTRESKSSTGA
jgi:hypothetical protein